MHSGDTLTPPRPLLRAAWHPGFLLALLLPLGWLSLEVVDSESLVPPAWPVAGLAAGVYLQAPRRRHPAVLAAVGVLALVVHLMHSYPTAVAAGFTLSLLAETVVVRRTLLNNRPDGRAALMDDGDVSQLIRAVALGAAVGATGYALTGLVTGTGNPWLALLATWGTHAAALMVLLPLFMATQRFPPLARGRERLAQALLTVGTTALLFASASVPLMVFVVMPMFAWLAFRGTLREATTLLVVVATIGTTLSALGFGPIPDLAQRFGLAPELGIGILQLFLIDCGLILLPLSVAVTQQRMTAARDAAGRTTLERLVSSATGTAIVATDPEGRVTLFNPGAEEMLGLSASQVLGSTPDDFLPADEIARHAVELGTPATYLDVCRALADSDEPSRLWQLVRTSGEQRAALATFTVIPGPGGEVAGHLCTAQDVTEQEEAQAALLLAVRRLQDLDEVKSNFLATVSHELRTPITSIIGYTELLEDGAGGGLSGGQANLVGRVDRNSRRLLSLIEDLLVLSRIEADELTLDSSWIDVRSVVLRAREAVSPALATRDLEVTLDVPDEPMMLHGDPAQLERVVVNLLTNAVKFTPDGGSVSVALADGDDQVRLEVADTGLGIPVEEQDRLFQRFFRSTTATEMAIQGTGIGLSIVHAIVTLHEGDIRVTSADRAGTTVTVTLPACEPARTTPMGHPGGGRGVSAS